MVNGNTKGIKQHILDAMDKLYEIKLGKDEFVTEELVALLCRFTVLINREISVYISRLGNIEDVSIGDSRHVELPSMRKNRSENNLSGIRCIHTHPNGGYNLSSIDIATLINTRLDAMCAIGVRENYCTGLEVGIISDKITEANLYGPYSMRKVPSAMLFDEIRKTSIILQSQSKLSSTEEQKERALLIGVGASALQMEELALLADTAGAEVVETVVQSKVMNEAGNYLGEGKLIELGYVISDRDIDLVIANDELSAVQQRNLEKALNCKVIDRTVLILDIFAKKAKSREGKLQVELAQLQYNLPRLQGKGLALSRLGAGIGTRGPGETKLESDRRRIRQRITFLNNEIKELAKQRDLRREQRKKNEMFEVALVGYTNAGKTSLLNALTNDTQYAENRLFATLDPVTRRLTLPSGDTALITDTVGFIDNLPHELVDAFRSTLEETLNADLILHVTDISNPHYLDQQKTVMEVLETIGAQNIPMLTVYNKCDLLDEAHPRSKNAIFVSAKTQEGFEGLLETIAEKAKPKYIKTHMTLKYSEGQKLSMIQKHAKDMSIDYTEQGIVIDCMLPELYLKSILSM